MVFEDGYSTLKRFIDESSNIVFFGGAGVSTESGIPDFRSTDGLYHQSYDLSAGDHFKPIAFSDRIQKNFTGFTGRKCCCLDAKPNNAHKKLAQLGRRRKIKSGHYPEY